jgi:inorganic triphosphatase YgiF
MDETSGMDSRASAGRHPSVTDEIVVRHPEPQEPPPLLTYIARVLPDGFVEIEYKLLADPVVMREIGRSSWLQSRAAGPVRREALVTRYYDTPDFKLRDAGFVLRVRTVGTDHAQSLKMRDSSVSGLFRRMEWQQTVSTDRPDIEKLFGSYEVLARFDIANADLVNLFTTRFERTTIPVIHILAAGKPAAHISMSLDDGAIEAGAVRRGVSEIELELVSGPEEGLHDFAAALRQRYPLTPGRLSKADRGFELICGETLCQPGVSRHRARPPDS